MRIIHCSQKLLKEMTDTVMDSEGIPDDNTGLGNWYSDVFKYKREKYLIFTNEQTLFSFFVYSVNKHDIETISSLFSKKLKKYLKELVNDEATVNRMIMEYDDLVFCKADNGTVVESMDFFIKIFESRMEFIEEITNREIIIANIQVNTTPMPLLNYASPLRKIKDLIDQKYISL